MSDGPYIVFLRDSAGAPITGKVKTDFDLTYYVDGVDTATTAITVTEIGTSGDYDFRVPDAATGTEHALGIESTSLGTADGWIQKIEWPTRIDTADFIAAGGTVTYDGPVAPSGDAEIVKGDDYKNADGRALEWTDTSWPTLTAGSVKLTVRSNTGVVLIDGIAGVVSGASTVYVELTSTNTDIEAGTHRFDVQATLTGGSVVTLQRGTFIVKSEVTEA